MLGMLVIIFIHFRHIPRLPKVILVFALIHFMYFVFFEINDFEALKYLLARLTFLIFFSVLLFRSDVDSIIGINKNNGIICLALLVSCLFLNKSSIPGRFSGVFTNPNELGAIGMYCYTSFSSPIFNNQKKLKITALILSFIMVILSGSRICLVGTIVVFTLDNRVKFSKKVIYFLILSLPFLQFLSQTFERIFSGNIFENRLLNWAVTINSISQKIYVGHGLKSYEGITDDSVYEEGAKWAMAGAHNGYLTYLLMFGVPLGIVVIIIMMYPLLASIKKNKYKIFNPMFDSTQKITGLWLLYSTVETTFTGVNDLEVILFFSSWITLIHFLNDKNIIRKNIYNDYRFNYR
jgi:O-antigen ligase